MAELEVAEVVMAIESPERAVSFDEVAATLQIPRTEVASAMIEAIAAKRIIGRIDEESATLIIDGAKLPAPSPELIKSTNDGLLRLEKHLSEDLENTKTTLKRNHSAIQ